ncbi:hypothetical protein SSX86_027177 [Deinandra increscens subsp. villosa]|uniref:DNA-directed RNA polymerase n=1 Tax=Deinandra increscens subsp. villosa TaxID=3103831 RepID=A0AAP0CFV2_9ASTR
MSNPGNGQRTYATLSLPSPSQERSKPTPTAKAVPMMNVDKFQLIPEYLKVRGLVKVHVDSFNHFIESEIKKIVAANNIVTFGFDPHVYLRYKNVRVAEPYVLSDGVDRKLYPQECRLADMTYAAPIYVNIEYSSGKDSCLKEVLIGRMPIMLKSLRCRLHSKDEDELAKLGECPLDPGGYFVVKGNEKVPIMLVMKAMGMENDQEVVQMLGREPQYANLLLQSIGDCGSIGVYTQQQALDFLEKKNYTGNKQLELPGQLLALLFGKLFKSMNNTLKLTFNKTLAQGRTTSQREIDEISKLLTQNIIITSGLERSLSTGNWEHMKGVTQSVTRTSFIGAFSSMTKISNQLGKSRTLQKPRALHPSQCHNLGVEESSLLIGDQLHSRDSFLVMMNGLLLGKHRRPQIFANSMRRLRRAGQLSAFVSIFVHEKQRCVYIASDGGRVCRPLVIADKGVSRIKYRHMNELKNGARNLDSFFREGLLEYLDVNEENNALIASREEHATKETTHIEIEPLTILGACAGLIPYPHHNHSLRNTYQCAMGKQAMGNIAYNQVGYDKLGAGQNATVAVMSYSGYDIKDAIVMNKSSLDRGFGSCIVMKRMSAMYKKYKVDVCDQFVDTRKSQHDPKKIQILDHDGLAFPGEILENGDIYLQKECPQTESQFKYHQETFKGEEGERAVVDRVALCSKDGKLTVKIKTRHTRRPEVGDKFSSRHGQKGVCGAIIQQEDFPFSELGICPDLIINPHVFQSQKSVGKMIELVGSKAAASCAKFHYGSAFGEPSGHADKVEDISETLVKHGFCYNGKDFLYSGITGEPLQAYIFMGPIYYQKSKHMVLDKMHARGMGPRELITRQPTKGRSRNGCIRVGEMERDCLIAHGTSNLIYERLMISSDPFEVQVCRKCGLLGYINYRTKTKVCSTCKTGDNVSAMKLPYAGKLLFQVNPKTPRPEFFFCISHLVVL